MTYMRAWMSLKFGQIRLLVPMATDRVIMEKTVLPLFSAVFHPILYILAGNDDMHESLGEFEFRPDRTKGCGVMALERCQKLVTAQYLENGWTEFNQILYTHYH